VDPERLAETLVRHDEKLDAILERVSSVEAKVDYTNGRVRGLEIFKARVLTVVAVGVFATPILLPTILH
jgi:hypothetical protein